MKKKIKYTNEPMKFKVVDDFLPPPEELALKEETIKVTLTINKTSLDFFKKYAHEMHGHYQTMIRKVLDSYATHYQQ